MILVFVTIKSYKKLLAIAPIVAGNLKTADHKHDDICYIKVDECPLIVTKSEMSFIEKTFIFISGLNIENQDEKLELGKKISAETGYTTTIL